jgi:hypothetical protein
VPPKILSTAISTFWYTVSQGSSEWFWNTTARSGPGAFTSLPSTMTPPEVALSRPATMFSTVDLPQPEWPISEMYSPRLMSRLMSLSTGLPPLGPAKVMSTRDRLR